MTKNWTQYRLISSASWTLTVLSTLACGGCGPGGSPEAPYIRKLENLQAQHRKTVAELEQCKVRNEQLRGQIKNLSTLPEGIRENPYKLQRINITKYTNFYDKDKDGKKDKFIVYIQPVDTDGDIVKAAGTVDVQIWNLNNPNGQALLGTWHIEPDALRPLWYAALISTSYRLAFDIPEAVEGLAEPFTVKVTFTDYLTGEVFDEQKAVEPL